MSDWLALILVTMRILILRRGVSGGEFVAMEDINPG